MAFGLFKKKKKEVAAETRFQTLKIKEVIEVAKEAVNVVFEKPEAGFQYKPGQFITIIKEVRVKKSEELIRFAPPLLKMSILPSL